MCQRAGVWCKMPNRPPLRRRRTLERRLDVLALTLALPSNGRIVDVAVLVDLERERLSVAGGRLLAPELERILGDRALGVGAAVAKVSLG